MGIRDWAGLKGYIDDRNLACSLALASEGRSESPRGRLGAAPVRATPRGETQGRLDAVYTPRTVGSASRLWQRRAGGFVVSVGVWGCAQFLLRARVQFFPALLDSTGTEACPLLFPSLSPPPPPLLPLSATLAAPGRGLCCLGVWGCAQFLLRARVQFFPALLDSTGTEACPLLFPSLSPPPLLPLSAHGPRVPARGAPRISARWPRLLEKINWFEHEGRCWGSHRRFSTSATSSAGLPSSKVLCAPERRSKLA